MGCAQALRRAADWQQRCYFGCDSGFSCFWRGHLRLLAAGGHDVLDPHVGHKVSVVFPVVYVIEVQCAKPRRVRSEQLHCLTS
jgi:hypothetical protein